MEALLYKKLLLYCIPLNFLIGDYNVGVQYRFPYDWAADVNIGYRVAIQGNMVADIYEDVFSFDKFYYHGPFIKASFVSLYARGFNPFRTDYTQVEFSYKLLSYEGLDFYDPIDTMGKVFNQSEILNAFGITWVAGYNIINGNTFHMDGFVGFGVQLRYSNILYNSYGYNDNSDQYFLGDYEKSQHVVPLFQAGIKVGLMMAGSREDSDE